MSKTLQEKLGLKPQMRAWAWRRPAALADIIPLPDALPGDADFSIGFVNARHDIPAALAEVLPSYQRGGHLWFAYPKKSGRIATDISRDSGWEPFDAHDLLPVSQVAIDSDWSALRFRYRDEIARLTRKKDRP